MPFKYDTGLLALDSTDVATTVLPPIVTTDPVHGVFPPTCIIFKINGSVAVIDTHGARTIRAGYGAAVSPTERICVAIFALNGADPTECNRFDSDVACIIETNTTGTVEGAADLNAILANGFELIIDTQFTTDLTVQWEAFGGDISQAAIATITATDAEIGSRKVVSGVSFRPTIVNLFGTNQVSGPPVGATQAILGVGWSDGVGEVAFSTADRDGQATTESRRHGDRRQCLAVCSPDANQCEVRLARLVMLDDGYSVRVDDATGSVRRIHSLMMGGPAQVAVVDFLTATDGTPFTKPIGFVPRAMSLVSVCGAVNTLDGTTESAEMSMGAFRSVSDRAALAYSSQDVQAAAECYCGIETDEVYINPDLADNFEGLMDVTDQVDPVEFTMDDADPSPNLVGGAAFGDAAPGAPGRVRNSRSIGGVF